MGHALAAVATGGTVRQIAVLASGDGMTFALGGMPMVVASAGYIGASLLGAAMVYFGRTQRGARVALWSLAALISCGLLLWVRGDAVGVLAGATWALVLVVAGRLLKGAAVIMLAQFVGIVQCLSATDALLVLFRVSWAKDVHSDAQNMAQATGIGAPFWAATWLMLSAVLVYVSVRAAWRNAP